VTAFKIDFRTAFKIDFRTAFKIDFRWFWEKKELSRIFSWNRASMSGKQRTYC